MYIPENWPRVSPNYRKRVDYMVFVVGPFCKAEDPLAEGESEVKLLKLETATRIKGREELISIAADCL